MKLTKMQQKFVEGIMEGKTQQQSFIDAGYSTKGKSKEYINVKASELANNGNVAVSLARIRDKFEERAVITREKLILTVHEALEMAMGVKPSKHLKKTMGTIIGSVEEKTTDLRAVSSLTKELATLLNYYPKVDNAPTELKVTVDVEGVNKDDF